MTLLNDDFMLEELDFVPMAENTNILYKDYYAKICAYIMHTNAFQLTPNEVEEWLESGKMKKSCYFRSGIADKNERKFWFKRAMGLQLIYDTKNGRNSIINGNDSKYDICRETKTALEIIGLVQPYGWF